MERNYGDLLGKVAPKVIRTEAENEKFTRILRDLHRRSASLTHAEKELARLLTMLIEDFETKRYRLPRASGVEALEFLMDQHGLAQKDLVPEFGTPSVVSEVLSGKRDLSKEHIRRLSRRFHVSPELFL